MGQFPRRELCGRPLPGRTDVAALRYGCRTTLRLETRRRALPTHAAVAQVSYWFTNLLRNRKLIVVEHSGHQIQLDELEG